MTDIPVVISDDDDGRAIVAAFVVLMGKPNSDEVFPVEFDRFAAAVGPGLPDFEQSDVEVLHSRAGTLYWELINEVPDTPGEQSAIGHALVVTGTDDQDYHWAEIIDAAARAAAQAAQNTGASNLQLIQALQSGKLDVTDAFTQALADARYERIGQGGGTVVAPEFVFLQDVSVGADTNRNTISLGARGNQTGNIVLSLGAAGIRIKAGSYLLTFSGLPDARSDRFNPLIGVFDGAQELANSSPVYMRGTANEANTSWQCALNLGADDDISFYARQGQVSTQGDGITGAGAIRNLRLMIQPVGGIKGEPGRDGDPGPAADVADDLPWKNVFIYPSAIAGDIESLSGNFYLAIEDKITTKTANRVELVFAGARVYLNTTQGSPDQATQDLFGQLNGSVHGGAVFRFSLTTSVRDNISNALSSAYYALLQLTITFTDGSTYSERLAIVSDSARFPNPPGAGELVPSGTLLEYAGSRVPRGFLDANGSLVLRATYPALYAAIGDAFGRNDGSTNFRLPNPNEAISNTKWIIKT